MLTDKKLQTVLDNILGDIKLNTDILDNNGVVLASSSPDRIGARHPELEIWHTDDRALNVFQHDNWTYSRFFVDKSDIFFLAVEGVDETTENYSRLIVSLLRIHLFLIYQKKNQNNTMRRLLTNKLTETDIQELVTDYKISTNCSWCVYVVKSKTIEAESVKQVLLKAFPRVFGDIVVLMDSMTVALVKTVTDDMDKEDLVQIAGAIEESILNEVNVKIKIGIGNVIDSINDVSRSYEEALNSIEVGNLFNMEQSIYVFDSMLLERLLARIPYELCEQYSKILFTDNLKKILNDEMIATIDKLFENSLNLSETARQLFVHRNTLVYRLDKIQKAIGLDLRNLHDAVTFKVIKMLMERYLRECCRFDTAEKSKQNL